MTGDLPGRGERGEAVEDLRELANRIGALIDADGIFGGRTESAWSGAGWMRWPKTCGR